MRNFLLSIGVVACGCFAAQASDVTLNVSDATDFVGNWVETTYKDDGSVKAWAHWDNLESCNIGGYVFTFTMMDAPKPSANTYYTAADASSYTIRVYRGNTVTITAPAGETMGSIDLVCASTSAITNANMVTADKGGCVLDGTTIKWTNTEAVGSVTFTVPTEKVGDSNPQIRINKVVVSSATGDVPTAPDYIYSNPCTSEDCGFVAENVELPEGLSYVWSIDSRYGLKASAYVQGTTYKVDSYMVSPVIDLSNCAAPVALTFDHAANFFNDLTADCGVYVREEGAAEWTEVAPLPARENSWTFSPVEMSLDAYAGKKVQIAFRYTSDGEKAGTWEIMNVAVAADEQDTPPVVVTGSSFKLTGNVESGKLYVMIADGCIAAPLAADKDYGYLQLGTCKVEGAVATAAEDLAFTIAGTADGYTLRQPDGRYLYQTGTYNSFNLSATETEECYWTISIEDDGAATITSKSVGKTIQYDPNYSSYGSYSDLRGVLPCLYVLDTAKVETIDAAEAGEAVYYDLNGRRVMGQPERGLYIKIEGNKATKVLVK